MPTTDPTLAAVVTSRTPILYGEGADAALDRPTYVRAGSSLARTRDGIAVVQDDANFIAIVDPLTGRARAITLPAGHGGRRLFDRLRGNKKYRLDLEACVAVEERDGTLLIALGSGAKKRREKVALVRRCESPHPDVSVVHVPRLYKKLRQEEAFAGSQMNVEGAIRVGDSLRLFGRGNGAARDGLQPVNATCDLDWKAFVAHLHAPDDAPPPTPRNIVRYELGEIDDVPLGFTDAAVWRDSIIYSAAAEDSPDVIEDGRVTGSAIGVVIDGGGGTRWAPLTEPSGKIFDGKVEGLVPADSVSPRFFVVVDADDPEAASQLCTVELRGPW